MASHTLSVLMDLLHPRRCSANCRERRGVRDGSQAGRRLDLHWTSFGDLLQRSSVTLYIPGGALQTVGRGEGLKMGAKLGRRPDLHWKGFGANKWGVCVCMCRTLNTNI